MAKKQNVSVVELDSLIADRERELADLTAEREKLRQFVIAANNSVLAGRPVSGGWPATPVAARLTGASPARTGLVGHLFRVAACGLLGSILVAAVTAVVTPGRRVPMPEPVTPAGVAASESPACGLEHAPPVGASRPELEAYLRTRADREIERVDRENAKYIVAPRRGR